ncbi:MAG TPA: DUF6644 family protein [Bryobacteraceae bacterium]|nr:DUF6644 family protein [Bryobacteraceae bacterium]
MTILGFCEWLQSLPLASGVKASSWQFPVIESIHSLGLSVMLWPAALLDMRLLGIVMKKRPVSRVAAQFLPWVWAGFVTMVLTGVVLFASEAVKCYNSPFFRAKLVLLVLAGLNALLFHTTIFRDVASWDEKTATPLRARVAGACSLAIWIGVVAMGRALAYA